MSCFAKAVSSRSRVNFDSHVSTESAATICALFISHSLLGEREDPRAVILGGRDWLARHRVIARGTKRSQYEGWQG